MSTMATAYTDGPPLYGDVAYEKLSMPLQAKAMVSGARHLFNDHQVEIGVLADEASAARLLRMHLEAHGQPTYAKVDGDLPWNIVRGVHLLVGDA